MRHKFNLDLVSLERFTMLIHGNHNTGKTHLVGDMLRSERANGEVLFVNVHGEDGALTLARMGLGDIGETVETAKDFKELVREYGGKGLVAVGVDSLQALSALVITDEVGDRLPIVSKDSPKNEWGEIHREMANLITAMRDLAPLVLVTCTTDKSMDQVVGKTYFTPDLPGRQAAGTRGRFDFVGYMTAETLGPRHVRRQVSFAPSGTISTRVRLPQPIVEPVVIPEIQGGWEAIKQALEKGLEMKQEQLTHTRGKEQT